MDASQLIDVTNIQPRKKYIKKDCCCLFISLLFTNLISFGCGYSVYQIFHNENECICTGSSSF